MTGKRGYAKNNLRFIRPIMRIGSHVGKESVMDSRTMKLQSLAAVYARERSEESLLAMTAEMESMKRYQDVFEKMSLALGVSGDYNANEINFECLRSTVDGFEARCGKFTDYGLGFIKYLSQACESMPAEKIM